MDTPAKPPRNGTSVLLGLLALIPATVLLFTGYLVPSVRTLLASFTDASLLDKPSESVGGDNYSALFDDFAESLVGPLLLAVALTFTALIGGLLLAWLAALAGRRGRWALRAAFALPMAAVGATMAAVAWLLSFESPRDLNPFLGQYGAFGALAVGLGATAFLLVLRRSPRLGDAWPGLLLVGGIITATSLAYALQSFTFPYLLRGPDGPRFGSPAMLIFDVAFRFADLGVASAGAVLLLAVLAVLGVGVAGWLIAARARVVEAAAEPAPDQPAGTSPWTAVSLVVTAVAALIALGSLVPWLTHSVSFSALPRESGVLPHLVSTWIPPLLSTLLGVTAAVLGGYGIGALRPLGRRSELLLLPFAPWLFTGLPALIPDAFRHRMEDGSEFLFLVPPASLSIPVLFGSALLFRGVRLTRALPVAGLAGLMVWVVAAQDTLWPLIAGMRPDSAPMQVVVLQTVTEFGYRGLEGGGGVTGWLYPLPLLLVIAAAIAAVQILSLDRLALRTGRDDPDDAPAAAPFPAVPAQATDPYPTAPAQPAVPTMEHGSPKDGTA
ncbi:hypothetical protein GCM10009679_72380 [Saccharothrix algeriensis]|uniref:Sugar ABC transporter permease n=1 Tax=Catellatospora bangladeshensis TaxID=310355 RepID=A0A8J3JK08_9ACTN|nr:hypothetical protein Cba03nite_75860 [Catellatospora bangladeshensis]